MFNGNRKIRSDVASALRVTKGEKAPTIKEEDVKGLDAFDASLYENQHKHSGFKQRFEGFDKPIINVTTESISEHKPYAIVQGVELSPAQLAAYHNSEFK